MKRSLKTVQLLVNPNAGQRKTNRIIAAATRVFKKPEWKLLVHVLSGAEEAYIFARAAAIKRRFAVLVAGGDGTINEVARGLAKSGTALGVIASGTGNGFARGLKLPLNIEKAVELLATARVARVDMGSLNGERVFVSVCGAGFDAWGAAKANQLRVINRVSGFLRYLVAGTLTAFEFRPQQVRVTVDKKVFEGPCLLCTVANGEQYGFGATIAPGARLDDGLLDVIILPPTSLLNIARNGFRLYSHKPLIGSRRLSGKSITIEGLAGVETPIHVDGEATGLSPAHIRVLPRALKILLP